MADKSFGVKELNLLNASGTPTVTSPNNLNLNANTVAISTSATVGNNLTVSGQLNVGSNIKIGNAGVVTATSFVGNGAITINNNGTSKIITGSGTANTLNANVNLTFDGTTLDVKSGTGNVKAGIVTATRFSGDPSNDSPHSLWDVVNNSASSYRFTGPGQDGAEDNPDIYLVRGQRYVFKMNASGHPFQIRVSNGGSAYSDGVTNNGAQTGNVVFNVQHDAPAHLFYQCTSHGSMVGNIYIVGQHLANGADNRVLTATSAYGMNGESNLTFDGTTLTTTQLNVSTGANSFETSANVFKGASGQKGVYLRSALSSATTPSYSSVDDTNTGIFLPGSDVFAVTTGGTERLRIDSSGRVLIGATSGGNADTDDLIISGSGKKGITLCSTDGNESRFTFADGLSGVSAVAGSILYTHSNDSMDFQTNTTRRLRIDSVGRVMIGTTDAGGSNADDLTVATSGNTGITIRSGTSSTGNIFFSDATSGAAQYAGAIEFYHSDNSLRFNVGNTNYLRIISSGSVRIGDNSSFTADTSADELVIGASNSGVNRGMTILNHTGQDGRICFAQSGATAAGMIKYSHGSNVLQFFVESEEMVRLNNTSVQGTPAMQLRKPNAASNVQSHMIHLIVGGHDRGALIAGSSFGSSAIVGAISDYRVKTNIRNYTSGWDNIKALPVKIFDINKEGEEATDIKGWIAHEVQSVIPEAVIGTKDAKKADGSDDLQSLGYNVFMPDVVGALQTAMAKIETLEAKVAALEGS